MINNDAYRMLELFKGQISLETDSQFVYGIVDMDVRKVVYWVAAAVLTITVTF